LAVGLAMDALSVAAATGFSLKTVRFRHASRMAASFGVFHVFMPIAGWLAGATIIWLIASYDHWVAFLLLIFVGGRMIYGALNGEEKLEASKVLSNANLLLFSVAVSIDAVAVGLSLYCEQVPILFPAVIMGVVTSVITFLGMHLGNRIGSFIGRGAPLVGGTILIAIGLRIVITHLLGL